MSDRYEIDLNVKPGDDLQDEEMAGMHFKTLPTTITVDICPLSLLAHCFSNQQMQLLQDYQDQP